MNQMYKSNNVFCLADGDLKERFESCTKISHFSTKKLKYRIFNNAVIQPTKIYCKNFCCGVLTEDDKFIRNSGQYNHPQISYPYDKENVININKTCIFIGCINFTWGHLITDGLNKLWFLFDHEFKKFYNDDCDIVYVSTNNEDIPDYALELYTLIGINTKRLVRANSIVRYKKIIIPDNSFYVEYFYNQQHRFFTKEYLFIINKIKKNSYIDEHTPKKIYLTRTKFSNNDL